VNDDMNDVTRKPGRNHVVEPAVKIVGSPPAEISPLAQALIWPQQMEKSAPCCSGCATGGDVRGWISLVAQREKLGLTEQEAIRRAWRKLTEMNPFPSTLGRICPHPCESGCSRREKDGAVAINALERYLGDWALNHHLSLKQIDSNTRPESIGVVGAGPAGLSFAYQMARRNYRVTIYEKQEKPGGMLFYGIPRYRLPKEVIDAEVQRILDLGVELKLKVVIGKDITVHQLKDKHDALFLGIGAGRGRPLDIPGEEGTNVWSGTDYLGFLNRGAPLELGPEVIIVGGGNTAVDAARSARRTGARVTMLYRRTRREMPAIESEIDDALDEGIAIEYLAAPVEIKRHDGKVTAVVAQRIELGEPDNTGRRKPVPIPGSEYQLPADSVITAVSQEPDWDELTEINPGTVWIQPAEYGKINHNLWAGGDALGLGIAGMAIAQGRQAAEAVHAQLRGLEQPHATRKPAVPEKAVKSDYHPGQQPAIPHQKSVKERLADPDTEVRETISRTEFLEEVTRCFSCGLCYGCDNCFMYCNAGGFTRLEQVCPGAYFALSREFCVGCGKCIDLCPSGFLTPLTPQRD
jgi:NADPH-dependent glutamate synthase beta subunit-like oxidoreductase/Pyruvate/2-oxoacid:ferredoxin oxidoreductase delta subunit